MKGKSSSVSPNVVKEIDKAYFSNLPKEQTQDTQWVRKLERTGNALSETRRSSKQKLTKKAEVIPHSQKIRINLLGENENECFLALRSATVWSDKSNLIRKHGFGSHRNTCKTFCKGH